MFANAEFGVAASATPGGGVHFVVVWCSVWYPRKRT